MIHVGPQTTSEMCRCCIALSHQLGGAVRRSWLRKRWSTISLLAMVAQNLSCCLTRNLHPDSACRIMRADAWPFWICLAKGCSGFIAPAPRALNKQWSSIDQQGSNQAIVLKATGGHTRDDYLKGALIGAAAVAGAPRTARADDDQTSDDEGPQSIDKYINDIDAMNFRVPDFPKGLEWVNADPISIQRDLRGKVVLLDFWTYCCINCMHILPSLAKLEAKYAGQPFAVIGVHSAKFSNEKDSSNIREAIGRYGIKHPVVNDRDMQMWNSVGVQSWPSLVLLSPQGKLLSIWAGEGYGDRVDAFVGAALKLYAEKGLLDYSPIPKTLPKADMQGLPPTPLSYPGKLAVDSSSNRLFVSDSGHNRIVAVDKATGDFLFAIGSSSGEAGFADGTFESARFSNPQGLTVSEDGLALYVADTDNHAVRTVDLGKKTVGTLAGNGDQGFDYSGGRAGKEQYLSSPWDVVLAKTRQNSPPRLLVAMAGTHQIWDVELPGGRAECYSGTGRESEQNAEDRIYAAWAQPSGVTLSRDGQCVYVADSESSSVRKLSLVGQGPTQTIVGGAGTPQNLFAFGDRDGKGNKARLQHPLAVASLGDEAVVVADSYNHKVKLVRPKEGTVASLAGAGKPGFRDGKGGAAQLWEPGGLAAEPDGSRVWIADTNNGAIRCLTVATGEVSTLELKGFPGTTTSSSSSSSTSSIVNRRRARIVDVGPVAPSCMLNLAVNVPAPFHLTKDKPSEWQLVEASGGPKLAASLKTRGRIEGEGPKVTSIKLIAEGEGMVELESAVYYCETEKGVCRTDGVVFRIAVSAGAPAEMRVDHQVQLKAPKAAAGVA